MPIPKKKQKLYGKIAGHMQNERYSYEKAKDIADRAIKVKKKKKNRKPRPNEKV